MEFASMENQQGMHMKKKEVENRQKVLEWLLINKTTSTMKKCQEDTGLSHVTVRKFMKELKVK